MIGLILIAIFALAIVAGVYIKNKPKKGQVSAGATPEQIAEAEELADLSDAAQRIVHQYRALPEELQIDDVLPMVKALDVKHGRTAVDTHFQVAQYSEEQLKSYRDKYYRSSYHRDYDLYVPRQQYFFSWSGQKDNGCQHLKDCEYFEYRALHEVILEATKAHREKERALEIAGVQHELNAVESLTARLREETGIMKAVAKELS